MKRNLLYTLSVILLIGVLAFYYCCDPNKVVLVPKCPFKLLTGWDCPSCGGQRALHAALHGHIGEAIALNPFFLIGIPVLIYVIIVHISIHGSRRRVRTELTLREIRLLKVRRVVVIVYIVAYFVWFVLRNI